jgi:hypothetical protein
MIAAVNTVDFGSSPAALNRHNDLPDSFLRRFIFFVQHFSLPQFRHDTFGGSYPKRLIYSTHPITIKQAKPRRLFSKAQNEKFLKFMTTSPLRCFTSRIATSYKGMISPVDRQYGHLKLG